MKKIIAALGIFAAGSIIQLIMGTIFLFTEVKPSTELCLMASLLVISSFGLALLDHFQKKADLLNTLTDSFRMSVYHCERLSGILLLLETLNVLIIGASFLFSVWSWLQGALMLSMVLVMIVAVLVVLVIIKDDIAKVRKQDAPAKESAEE